MRLPHFLATCFAAAIACSTLDAQPVPPKTVQERFSFEGQFDPNDPLGLTAKNRLLQRAEVMQELSIDDDQKARLEAIFKEAKPNRGGPPVIRLPPVVRWT